MEDIKSLRVLIKAGGSAVENFFRCFEGQASTDMHLSVLYVVYSVWPLGGGTMALCPSVMVGIDKEFSMHYCFYRINNLTWMRYWTRNFTNLCSAITRLKIGREETCGEALYFRPCHLQTLVQGTRFAPLTFPISGKEEEPIAVRQSS